MQLIISQILFCSRLLIWYPLLPDCWHPICSSKCPQLAGSSWLPGQSSPTKRLWVLLILSYIYLAWWCSWRVWANACRGHLCCYLSWGGGRFTRSHSMSSKHQGQQQTFLPAPPRSRVTFWQQFAEPSFPGLGRLDCWLPKWLGREKVNNLLPCPPVRVVGLAVWLAGWVVVACEASIFVHHGGKICPAVPFAQSHMV